MSTWLCGVEPRWTMGAPSCFVTSFLRNLENELPADTEQCPPGVLREGLDHGDFLIAMAPKPVIMMGQERDYFDVRGLMDTYHDVRHVYDLLGQGNNVAWFIGANDHGYHQDAREAMYKHFNKATGRGGDVVHEPALTIETDAVLQCTKSGQVDELKSRPVYSFTNDLVEQLAKERGEVDVRKAVDTFVQLMCISPCGPVRTENYRILRAQKASEYPFPHLTTYVVEMEGRIQLPIYRLYERLHYSRPPKSDGPAILYVAHDSSDVELKQEPLIRDVLKTSPDAALYAIDVRGLGESRPNTCGDNSYYTAYGCDYFYGSYSVMLDKPYVGRRIDDIQHALKFIHEIGGHPSIHVVAKGYGAIPAAMMSLFSDKVSQVTLKHAPTSYADIASAEVYGWPLSSFVPGVLKVFDLPDVYRELKATKKLTMIDPVGADGPPKS